MDIREAIQKNPQIIDPSKLHRFEFTWECRNGNPNGDPDNGGDPRVTPDDRIMVTDVCAKRWVRDYVELEKVIPIYISRAIGKGKTLQEWCEKNDVKTEADAIRIFWDVRLFGAVALMKGKAKAKPKDGEPVDERENAQIRGPVQIFAGYSPPGAALNIRDITISRLARQDANEDAQGTFGHRAFVERVSITHEGTYNAIWGIRNNVTPEDLSLFWEALVDGVNIAPSVSKGDRSLLTLKIKTYSGHICRGTPTVADLTFTYE